MSSILATLGLRAADPFTAPPPSLTSTYLIFHFLFATCVLNSRIPKRIYGLDHNASPREDLQKYGLDAVKAGKLTQAQLDQLRRIESASANSVEQYALLVGTLMFAHVAGVPVGDINRAGFIYSAARIVYALNYVIASTEVGSLLRGVAWWTSNVACFRLMWTAGELFNSKVML